MIKYCLEHWDRNKRVLQGYFQSHNENFFRELNYKQICRLTFLYILDRDDEDDIKLDLDNITEIDNGDYQGTLLYLIPFDTYQPNEDEYFMTYTGYGSCSGCDTLLSLQSLDNKKDMIKELMLICKDLIANCIVPYNYGWRHEDKFDRVEWKE